jgi:hypothetical protein
MNKNCESLKYKGTPLYRLPDKLLLECYTTAKKNDVSVSVLELIEELITDRNLTIPQ